MKTPAIVALTAALVLVPRVYADDKPRYERRWVYCAQNLLVEKNADAVVALIERSGRAGYNGLVLADYKLNILGRMPKEYFRNANRVRQAAARSGVEIIPAVFPIGYSEGLLAHDPNLAEGLPVVEAPFVVKGREAVLVPEPSVGLANGDLEQTKGDRFLQIGFQDDPGKASFADRSISHSGKVSCRFQDVGRNSSSGNGRLIRPVKVRPHACYLFSCWVKTKDLTSPGAFHLNVLGAKPGGRGLTFHEGGAEANQDWKRVEVVFNTLDQSEVNLYVGLWGGKTGTLWVDDLKLEELALVNVLRREGCPLAVTSADGKTIYEEGRDFEPVRDPKLGADPYAGLYSFDHSGAPLRLTANSRISDGKRLLVSWHHPVATHGSQIASCLSDPKVFELLTDQARRVNDLFHPKMFFMSHDELRVANWCRTCQDRRMTPGKLLADNVKRCSAIIKEVSPKAEIAVWSDMFDPHHNAVRNYYLINGSLEGSWNGVAPEIIIANWNGGMAKQSLSFFAGRGHRQVIAGYYDGDDLANFREWDAAARGLPRVIGFMYTTWENKYGLLDKYGRALRTNE